MKPQTLPVRIAAILLLALASRSVAQVTIDVFPTIAPNVLGSPNASAWMANAFTALSTGNGSSGTAGTPGFYTVAPASVLASDVLVTSFASWRGLADPGTAVGSAFAAEGGNRLHFSLVIDGHGQTFSLAQLSFTFTSSDPANALGFTFATGTYNYSEGYVGVLFGTDGKLGGGDDTFISSGANTQQVDALVGRGSGNAWWPQHTTGDGLTDQQVIDNTLTFIAADTPILATGTYSLDLGGGTSVSGQNSVTIIPEPATSGLLLSIGGIGYAFLRRRRPRSLAT